MTATEAAILFGAVAAAVMLGLVFLRSSKDEPASHSICTCRNDSAQADEGIYCSEGSPKKSSACTSRREHVES
ncbi:MAG: hypothetical protein ACOCZU_03360 [Planctomycetota bacterium]